MRFSIKQLLVGVAFVALASAYFGQSVRYHNLEVKYTKAKQMVKGLADITITDGADGPYRDKVTVRVPEDWPDGIKDEWKDVHPEDKLEFLKSGKRLPVEVSSRFLNLKTQKVQFPAAAETELKEFLKEKLYWLGLRSPNPAGRIWIADPTDAQYLNATREQLVHAAAALEAAGLCVTEGDFACPSGQLEQQAGYFQSQLQKTLDRAVAKFNLAMKQ